MYPTTQQYSSTWTNQTNILCSDSLCPGNFGKRLSGALQIELEGQRVGKTYKSHFPIVLRIQFHTRRRALNPLRAPQPSQIDLPASSIIDSSALNNPTTPSNPRAPPTPTTLPHCFHQRLHTTMPSTKAQGRSTAVAGPGPKHNQSTAACEPTCDDCHWEDTKPNVLKDFNLPEDLRYTMRQYLSQDPSAEPWQPLGLKARFGARL